MHTNGSQFNHLRWQQISIVLCRIFHSWWLVCSLFVFNRFNWNYMVWFGLVSDSFKLFLKCCLNGHYHYFVVQSLLMFSYMQIHRHTKARIRAHIHTNQRRTCYPLYMQSLFSFELNSQLYRCTEWPSFTKIYTQKKKKKTAKPITHGQSILLPLITMNIQKSMPCTVHVYYIVI